MIDDCAIQKEENKGIEGTEGPSFFGGWWGKVLNATLGVLNLCLWDIHWRGPQAEGFMNLRPRKRNKNIDV